MKYILTFKLFDGTKMKFITTASSKSEAREKAVKFSGALFGNHKFVIRYNTDVLESTSWKNANNSGINDVGSKMYLVSVIYDNCSQSFTLTANSEKTAYNKIKMYYGIDNFSLFAYDNGQNSKIISVYDRASFLLGNRQAFDRFMDNIYKHSDKIKILKPYIKDIQEFENMAHDYMNGTYRQIPMNTIITIVGVLLYFVSPVNLSFEWIPVIGQLDDITLISLLIHELRKDIAEYRVWKQQALKNNQIGLSDNIQTNGINTNWCYNEYVVPDNKKKRIPLLGRS